MNFGEQGTLVPPCCFALSIAARLRCACLRPFRQTAILVAGASSWIGRSFEELRRILLPSPSAILCGS